MKTFWSIIIGLVIIIFALVFFGWNYLPSWISRNLSEKAGVPVSISHLSMTPKKISVYNLKVRNTRGSKLPFALKVKKIASIAPLTTYFHENLVIDQLNINRAYLGLEFESAFNTKGNWTVIMNNLRRSLREDSAEGSKKVLIKKLVIRNLNIDLVFRQGSREVKHLKPIKYMEFHNVSSEGGLQSAQIMNLIMSEVLKEVFSKENLMNMLKDALESPGRGGSGVFNNLKSLFSKLEETKLEKIQ